MTEPRPDPPIPHGPGDAEALVGAAMRLFSERGPENVSTRQVAQAAGVDQRLVDHYFGSKDGLVGAVLDQSAAEITAAVERSGDGSLLAMLGDNGAIARHGRLMAHLLLDWRDPASLQTEFPALGRMVERLEQSGVEPVVARRRVAQITALIFGWHLFEPFLTEAVGMEPGEVDTTIATAEGAMLLLAELGDPPGEPPR